MVSSTIVVANPLTEYFLQITFTEWDQEVQAFSPNRPDQPFAECVRFRRSNRRLQNTDAKALQRRVQPSRENGIAVVDDVAVTVIECQELAELLGGPFGGWMLGHVAVQNPPRADLHGHENVH